MVVNVDQQSVNMDDLAKTEVAIAQWLGQDASPDAARRAEGNLLRGVEERRRFEQWRRGVPLSLELDGFIRTRDRIELRGKLRQELPDHGTRLRGSDGRMRFWAGPGMAGRGEMIGVDDLPAGGPFPGAEEQT